MISSFRFKVRLAIRNISYQKGSSIAVFLSLGLVMMFAIALFNIYPLFQQLFHHDARERYLDTDIIMTFDENATARLINRRTIVTDYSDEIDSALSFFNLYVFTEAKGAYFYTELMAASPHEMELLIDTDLAYLSDNEVIITQTMASEYQLAVGNSLSINMLNQTYQYDIKQVIPDRGLFAGIKIFVDKAPLIADFFSIMVADNLGNTIYIDTADTVDATDVLGRLKEDTEYHDYRITLAEDTAFLTQKAKIGSATFSGLGLLIFITMIVVLHSLFPTLSKRIERQMGLVRILGGNPRFSHHVWSIQLGTGLVLSLIFGIFGTLLFFNLAARAYQVDAFIKLSLWPTLGAVLLVVLFVAVEEMTQFQKMKKQSEIAATSDFRYEKQWSSIWVFLLFLGATILIEIIQPFGWKVDALIIICLSVFTAFLGISVFLRVIADEGRKAKKQSVFRLFTLRYLRDNKLIHHSLRVLFVSFAAILIALSVRTFIDEEQDRITNQLALDYIILNIFDYQESLRNDIETDYAVSAKPSAIYQNVLLNGNGTEQFSGENLDYFVSMDYQDFTTMFQFPLTAPLEAHYLTNEFAYVILPSRYYFTKGLQIGDQVSLQLNETHGIISIEVAGFFDSGFDEFVYSNIAVCLSTMTDFRTNSLVIDTGTQPDLLQQLANRYGSQMYYVLSIHELADRIKSVYTTAGDLFMILTSTMIVSFMAVIINNLALVFQSMKKDYAKLKTMGIRNRDLLLNIGKEAVVTGLIVCLFILAEIFILIEHLPRIMLFFNYYQKIVPSGSTVAIAMIIMIAVFSFSYGLSYVRLKRMNLIQEVRME